MANTENLWKTWKIYEKSMENMQHLYGKHWLSIENLWKTWKIYGTFMENMGHLRKIVGFFLNIYGGQRKCMEHLLKI